MSFKNPRVLYVASKKRFGIKSKDATLIAKKDNTYELFEEPDG